MNLKTLPYNNSVIILLFGIGIMLPLSGLKAQTSCAEKLEFAQNLYAEGKIHLIEETVSECLENGFTKEEKIEAFKLLTLTYTYLEEDDKADNAVLNLLKFAPEYKVNPDLDPAEFIKLHNKFRTYPILKVGVKGVANSNFFSISQTRVVFPVSGVPANIIKSQIGIGGGIDVEIPYEDFLEFVPGIYYSSKSYTVTTELLITENGGTLGTNSYVESQDWIELPLIVRYKYTDRLIHPYGEAGLSIGYLFTDDLTSISTDRIEGSDEEGPKIDMLNSRNQLNYSLTAGAGIKFDIPMAEIVIGTRFNYSINQLRVVNSIPTPEENELWFKYGVIEPNYKMHTLSFFIGYMRKIYKPKKIYE